MQNNPRAMLTDKVNMKQQTAIKYGRWEMQA